MVAEFRDTQLPAKYPSSSDHLEYVSRHSRWKIDGAKVVFDSDMSDMGWI
jgi:hypothetical protein